METTESAIEVKTLKVGRDQVTISEKQLIIDAAAEMPDWQVREFNRSIIYFQDKKYFLRQKSAAKAPYRFRYVLEPWPTEAPTSGGWFTYDEEAVAQRDAAIKAGHFEDVARAFLYLLFPFLGFLWSGTKDKLARFGIVPRTVTGVSIMLTFGAILLTGVFAKMLLISSLKTGVVAVGGIIRAFHGKDFIELGSMNVPVLWLDVALLVCMILDVLFRYSQHLKETDSPWGFMEWIKCLVPRGKKAKPAQAPSAPVPLKTTTETAVATVPAPAPVAPASSAPPPLPVEAAAPDTETPRVIPGPKLDQPIPFKFASTEDAPSSAASVPSSGASATAVPAPVLIPAPRLDGPPLKLKSDDRAA